jgi:hypothetical protein
MSPLSPLRRLLVVLLAIVQVGAPVLAAVAHAHLARQAGGVARVHAEEPEHQHAPPDHPESCVLCQALSRAVAAPPAEAARFAANGPPPAPLATSERGVAHPVLTQARTRAPPELV